VGVLVRVNNRHVGELNVVVLVDTDESALHHQAILELNNHSLADQGLKKREEVLFGEKCVTCDTIR
jgi:hypothetical protein